MDKHPLIHMDLNTTIDKSKPVIIGLSGGVDSMVLFDVLHSYGYALVIAHVNHKKRVASDQEQTAIERLAQKNSIPIEVLVLDDLQDQNFQAKARDLRLNFFLKCAHKYHTTQVVLAHHLDDQLETFFMRLIKGSPVLNLTSIDPVNNFEGINFIRPFIQTKKTEILRYALEQDILYFEDASNDENTYTRNRFRNQILPILLNENPSLHIAVNELIESMKNTEALVSELSRQFSNTYPQVINLESFNALNPLIKDYFLRDRLSYVSKTTETISKKLINRILQELMSNHDNFTIPVGKHLIVRKYYQSFIIEHVSNDSPKPTVILEEGSYTIDETTYVFSSHKLAHNASNSFVLWYNEKVFPLYLRPRMSGDKIHFSYGHKKIQAIYIDEKIAPHVRDVKILLTNDREVLWIPFLKLSKHQEPLSNKLYISEVPKCLKKTSNKS